MIEGMAHITVKTGDVEGTARFYQKILGMVRVKGPAVDIPVAWMAPNSQSGDLIHIFQDPANLPAGEAASGNRPGSDNNGGGYAGHSSFDHFAVHASGYQEFRRRFREAGLDWREQLLAGTQRWQLFLYDPNGVMIELMFDGEREEGPGPDMSEERRFRPGEYFFTPHPDPA